MGEPRNETSGDRLTRAERVARTEELLARLAVTGERPAELEDEVVRINMVVAREIARRYEGRGIPAEDLQQVAYLGLVQAVRRFDVARSTDFLSFAVPSIRGELRRWFRDAGWMVRPPRSVQELQTQVAVAQEELWQALGRAPRPSEIAAHLDVAREQVVDALTAHGCFVPASLDAPAGGEDAGERLADRLQVVEPGYSRAEARADLRRVVAVLSPRERRMLGMRFLDGATQAEIGSAIGVTQMQVSRLLSGLFARLRDRLRGDDGGSPLSPAA